MMESESILKPTLAANSPETIQVVDVLLEDPRLGRELQELDEDKGRDDEGREQGEAGDPRDEGLRQLAPEEAVDEEADCGKYRYEPDIVSHHLTLEQIDLVHVDRSLSA